MTNSEPPSPSLHLQTLQIHSKETRNSWFLRNVADKAVLHVGCTDFPIRDKSTNLHLMLNESKVCSSLHGTDSDLPGLEWLSQFVESGTLYHIDSVILRSKSHTYDICLMPETIEHIPNPLDFLLDIKQLNFTILMITAPMVMPKDFIDLPSGFVERVHRDHFAWYSPYTLSNLLTKAGFKPQSVSLLNNSRMVGIIAIK